jgi:U6 snRNA-associated Sm-like protein LSm8
MVSHLDTYIEKEVSVLTTDGKYYAGVLKGFDQAINLFLANSTLIAWNPAREDVFTDNIIIRGDTVVMIGLNNALPLPDQASPIKSII